MGGLLTSGLRARIAAASSGLDVAVEIGAPRKAKE
jgi:hypothetical protein